MDKFDNYLKEKAEKENFEVPEKVNERIDALLKSLPETKEKKTSLKIYRRCATVAASIVFVMLFLLPNLSIGYAKAMEDIPFIGKLIQVVTARNYFYDDGNHEMNIKVPEISENDSIVVDRINKDINELTDLLVNEFYKEMEISGKDSYGSLYVDYETVTDTDDWFTLKISINEVAASSNCYFKYYHIDKKNDRIVTLGDLYDKQQLKAVAQSITTQMKDHMKNDSQADYWIEDEYGEYSELEIRKDTNFYFNEKNETVIVFDKYEVGPGYMGCPEFTIDIF